MTTTDDRDRIGDMIESMRKTTDFLKIGSDIKLINVKDDKDIMYGTIKGTDRASIQDKNYSEETLNNLIHDDIEKSLMITPKLPKDIDKERFKYLKEGDRVLVYEDKIAYPEKKKYEKGLYKSYKHPFTTAASLSGNENYRIWNNSSISGPYIPILYKGVIVSRTQTSVVILRDEDTTNTAKSYNIDANSDKFQLRIIDRTKDIESIKLLIYDNKRKIKIEKVINNKEKDNIKRDDKNNILLYIDEKIYKVEQSTDATEEILNIEQKIKQSNAKIELGQLKYKLRWNYKTNYSGSKYFPLKVSNIKLLSESEKYSQVDKYTDLKEGDIVKYNDSSHKNYGLLAKVVSIGEDTRDATKYYETRKLYTITFEPFESYIPTAELKQYKRKYQNMEKSIANVSASKLLKFRFVEVFYYEKDIFDTVKDAGKKEGKGMDKKKEAEETATDEPPSKLDKLNDFIVKNTLNTLKKNARFIPDHVLGKHQPESKTDLNKLIKPNNKNAYIISHTPSIKKRPNGLYFDYAETKERGVIGYEINIYVDLTLFQSKVITQEEWDNKTLTEKLGNIFLDKIKNSEAGVFNCPNRWDKVKNIMGNIKQGIWFSDIASDPNLIKQSFKKNSQEISRLKVELTKQEDVKKTLEQEIKEAQKSSDIGNLQQSQEKLQAIDKVIKEKQKKIIQLEAVTSYKGGMKSRYTKKARKTRKKTKPLNKYIKVKPRKTRKGLKLLL